MKLTRKWKLRIVIGVAIFFILYGILDYFFKFNFNEKVVSNIEMILMIGAFALLFSHSDQANTKQSSARKIDSEESSKADKSGS